MLIEVDGCIYDSDEFSGSYGYQQLDPIGKESFVNHKHFSGENRLQESSECIDSWTKEMKAGWPGRVFRIYRQIEDEEITVRFHQVRDNDANWSDSGVEIIEIAT